MNFMEIAQNRQSCRSYDSERAVEEEKLTAVLEAARLAPSACNGQPYHITVCRGQKAGEAAAAIMDTGRNKFAAQVPVILVISEEPYVEFAALGAKEMGIDYRSIDIGIVAAYITAEAAVQGLGTCMLGRFNEAMLQKVCGLDNKIYLAISLGYPEAGDSLRDKKRKALSELVSQFG